MQFDTNRFISVWDFVSLTSIFVRGSLGWDYTDYWQLHYYFTQPNFKKKERNPFSSFFFCFFFCMTLFSSIRLPINVTVVRFNEGIFHEVVLEEPKVPNADWNTRAREQTWTLMTKKKKNSWQDSKLNAKMTKHKEHSAKRLTGNQADDKQNENPRV